MRHILIAAALLALVGCASPSAHRYDPTHQIPMTPEQKAQALVVSQQKADILKKLPADADFENISEQIRLHELEQYIDINGNRRSYHEKPATVQPKAVRTSAPQRLAAPAAAPRPVRKAPARAAEESISFDPLPPPIDILRKGSR